MYYTRERTNITKNIESGRTTLFIGTDRGTERTAEKLAKEKRSYVFDVMTDDKDQKRVMIGFGVPK